MTIAPSLIAYLAAAGLLTLTPGLDTAMVLRSATVEGRRAAALAATGIGLGCLVWGAGVALGLGALLTASTLAFTALKWAGAAYLLYLGARLLLKPRRTLLLPLRGEGDPEGVEGATLATPRPVGPPSRPGVRGGRRYSPQKGERHASPLSPLRRGLLTNLLNPKVGVFYVSFLPQFTPPDVPMAPYVFMLACIHVIMGLIWSGVLIAATVPIGRYMARPGVVTVMDRLTGCVFLAFGARLALARR